MFQADLPDKPESLESFLEWEARSRRNGSTPANSATIRKFRDVVRRCGRRWLGHPARRIRPQARTDGCALLLEFQYGGTWFPCLVLQSHLEDGLYTLKGPGPNRVRAEAPQEVRNLFERLLSSWRDWDESEGFSRHIVTVYLHSWSAARLDKYVKSAVEATEVLCGRPPRPSASRRKSAAKASRAPRQTRRTSRPGRRGARR